jgi:hypothetical protein
MVKYDESEFRRICKESSSMAQASTTLGIHFNTFKRIAVKLDCYNPNQSGKGTSKHKHVVNDYNFSTEDILGGLHPSYGTFKLKNRLLREGYISNICSVCNISEWNDMPLNMELDHIDGDRTNHSIDNLRMLCPNCHAQTPTYRAKNMSLNREIC